ncbi:indolepyruvate ferredoxin oxidoreductase family protein [Nocardia sp. NPDC005745]|uniref:indolepyruvate ferredoxin oxidoreductase family protein n=1 Tax=Nocardia sp. NPDC005745 TaxID=3157061 RepID=UPI0033CB2D5B
MTQTHESSSTREPLDLNDRYRPGSGAVLMTGVQAVARLLVEQHERDRRGGRRVATLVSGYQGSPLAGLDQLLAGLPLLAGHDVKLTPAVNEELAATTVWGSQLELPMGTRTHDGVVGVWYGKGPGFDRSTDALRHANMYGAHPTGGGLLLVGDDPAAKSSSVPAASEKAIAALNIPILFPRNAEEIIAFGMIGIALSRASGCLVALKIVADVADGIWTVDRNFADLAIRVPTIDWDGKPWAYRQRVLAAPPDSLLAEADLYGPRWSMVKAFVDANPLDTVEVDPANAWLTIAAVGSAYNAVRDALTELGLPENELRAAGVRVLRIGAPFPLGKATITDAIRGVTDVLVIEDKTPFVETQVKEMLYGAAQQPAVLGKADREDRPLIPADGELTAARLLGPLRRVLRGRVQLPASASPGPLQLTVLPTRRTPYFCSGCPHNRSTVVPDGSLAGGGIGCHTLVTMSSRTDSQVTGLTQMGGEGAQWIGQAPFTDIPHIFQNVGDGTYFHSGQLAVQACIAAGVNITYKVLFNSAVAMTGAQSAEGGLTIPELTHKLHAEGVQRIIICADDPHSHRTSTFAPITTLWGRDRLDEAQRILRDTEGVTVLIYDQHCAADARRKRKRGTLPNRNTRIIINEAVCEGCGDCGVKSNCLSVQPVDTEFGRKTRIDQDSCNTDYSCLDGDCPSFVTVEIDEQNRSDAPAIPTPPATSEPTLPAISGSFGVFLAGIGGTGIVTVNQMLGIAALRSGLHVEGLDQTGLSQKAGPVTSHLRLSTKPLAAANRVMPGSADSIIAFDLLTLVEPKNLTYASNQRTTAVVSTSITPTGDMVYSPAVQYPDVTALLDSATASTYRLVDVDALSASRTLFGDTTPANLVLVGAAYQLGALPIPAAAIEEAIQLNGVAVEANTAAFRWGRVLIDDPAAFRAATRPPHAATRSDDQLPVRLQPLIEALPTQLQSVVSRRAAQLSAYQNTSSAADYIALITRISHHDTASEHDYGFTEAVARGAHQLRAYKDEYEVARMLTDPAFLDAISREVAGATNLTYRLHPPLLKALGRKSKIGLKASRSRLALRALAKARVLRGTPLDLFGRTAMRRLERALSAHYEAMVIELAANLTPQTYRRAFDAATLAAEVRGYEDVKIANVRRYLAALEALAIDTAPVRMHLDRFRNGSAV